MMKNLLRFMRKTSLAIMLLLSFNSWSQLSITAPSTDYTQNFNALTSGTWTNNSTLTGWYARTSLAGSITSYGSNSGATAAAGFYSYGPANEKALGHVISNATGTGYIGLQIRNNTGSSITSVSITYTGEQ